MWGSDRGQAKKYESWYNTPFGRRTDRVEKEMLGYFLSDVFDVRSLLEVGCGTGHFARWFAGKGITTVGLDASFPMLGMSKELCAEVGVVQGDATRLPFEDDSFDVVAMITVLEFLDEPEKALAEALRVARRGLLLGVLNSISPIMLWRRLRQSGTYGKVHFYSPRVLERLVKRTLGDRAGVVRWRTGLYPLSCLDGLTWLPFGAFIGMSVRLEKRG